MIGAAGAVCASDSSVTLRDKHFLKDSSEVVLEAQRLGELAQSRGQSDEVKQLGQKVAQDYGQARQQLSNAAQSAGIAVTPQLTSKAARMVNHLTSLSGPEFDRAIVQELFSCEESGAHQLDLENRDSHNSSLRQLATSIQTAVEPDLWTTTQLKAEFNGHI